MNLDLRSYYSKKGIPYSEKCTLDFHVE